MNKRLLLLPILSMAAFLTACNVNNSINPNNSNPNNSGTTSSTNLISYDDLDNYDEDKTTSISKDDNTSINTDLDEKSEIEGNIEVPDSYDSFSGNEITKAGKYYLKGDYSKIWINASKGSELYIYLDGVNITSTEGIAFGSNKQVTLHLIILNKSTNIIKNDYEVSDTLTEANAFHIKGDVFISGEGYLNVTSTVKGAIKVSKNLSIYEGVNIIASSIGHSIAAQTLSIYKANLDLNSEEKDGINVECDGELNTFSIEQGYVDIKDSDIKISTHGDGIQAATYVNVSGGKLTIDAEGEFLPYSSSLITSGDYVKDDFKFIKSGDDYQRVASDEIRFLSSSYYCLKNSTKGIKVAGIEYEDGSGNIQEVTTGDYLINIDHLAEINIESYDDSIHTNYGDLNVDSSNLSLATFDDGLHADYDLLVNNSSIIVKTSYEGLEGSNVTINGENTNIVAISSDDGINAASDYGTTHNITINNGYIRVYAAGDGLDANTALIINNGTVIVEGPGNNNGSLDAEQVKINGGLVFACSTNGMQENTTVTQNAFLYQGSVIAANTLVTIADSNNNALFSYTLRQSCNQIIFSSKDLVLKSSYKILSGTTTLATITLSSNYTKVGTASGGQPGGNPGGPGGGGWPRF